MCFVWFALLALPMFAAAQQSAPVSSQAGQPQQPNAPPAPPTRPEDLCSIEGQAVNAITGEPVKKAQITMNSLGGRATANLGAVTDATGRFVIENIEPGRYNLSAERNGFVRLQYGARGPGRPGAPLLLNPGQRTRDLVFRLVPQAVIAGHVVDEDGEPVENVQIQAMRYSFIRGKRQLTAPEGGSTDDLGEYRVFGLAPGKYYLSATYRRWSGMMTQDRKPAESANEGYVPTYYPGTNDPANATAIDVAAGAVLTGVDLTLRKSRTVRIRGHVVNPTGEGLPSWVMIRVLPRGGAGVNFSMMGKSVQGRGGIFEIGDLTPGAYVLTAQWFDEKSHIVRQPIDIGNTNLDDVTVMLMPGLSLKGQVRVDGTGEVNLASLNISLMPQGPLPMGGAVTRVKDDGTFSLDDVNADVYSVTVRGLPPNFYVKSIRMGDTDGLEAGLDLTQGAGGLLDILISPNAGEVDGSVADPKGQFASGATVVLVPDAPHRERLELFKTAASDTSGHFSLKGISPGEYKLFAWEDIETGAYQDPEFLQPFESLGESVTIREGSHENRQLKLIPAESTPKSSGG